jgi:hypothetical protein
MVCLFVATVHQRQFTFAPELPWFSDGTRLAQCSVVLTSRLAVAVACASLLGLPGCAAQQRGAAGATVGLIGAGTAVAGISIATGYYPTSTDANDPHAFATSSPPDDDKPDPNPAIGVPTLLVGLTLTVIGGILFGTAATVPHSPPVAAPSVRPGPSPAPTF